VEAGAPRVRPERVEAERARQVHDGRGRDRDDGVGHVGHHVVGGGDDEDVDAAGGVPDIVAAPE
jgi:hypothetical protein